MTAPAPAHLIGDWRERARCVDSDPRIWSPTTGRDRLDVDRAEQVAWLYCSTCPTYAECREWASTRADRVVAAGAWWERTDGRLSRLVELLPVEVTS